MPGVSLGDRHSKMCGMTERAYKYRFFATAEQENLLRRTMVCVCLVYNKALGTKTKAWYKKQERVDYKKNSQF